MQEQWKPIAGYEGIYEISNTGKVRSLAREIPYPNGKSRKITGYEKKAIEVGGYLYFCLSKDGKSKRFAAHRLVASAFLENPDNKPEINHKDCDKKNNRVDNLEWVTRQENVDHAVANGRIHPYDRKGEKNPMFGRHQSKLAKEKIGEVHRGFLHTQETKEKMSASHKGKKFSSSHRMALSQSLQGAKSGYWCVTNGQETRCLPQKEAQILINKGWRRGRTLKKKAQKER